MRVSKVYLQFLGESGIDNSARGYLSREIQKDLLPLILPTSKNSIDSLLKIAGIKPIVPLKFIKNQGRPKGKLINITPSGLGVGISKIDLLPRLSKSQRGLQLIEGIFLAMAYPEILDQHAIDCIDTIYGKECVPTIFKWKGKKYFSAINPYVADKMCAAPLVSCVNEIKYLSELTLYNKI